MSQLVNHTTILIMGGYAISAAFAKCQIELYIAAFLQRRFKKQPNLFLLAIMLMGLFLSMWISNHTAPVLCVSVLLPIIRDFPTDSAYVKTLLIGLAFACNLGGMMTPIASLQNTLAVSYLEKAGYNISFGEWMAIATPFCTITTILVSHLVLFSPFLGVEADLDCCSCCCLVVGWCSAGCFCSGCLTRKTQRTSRRSCTTKSRKCRRSTWRSSRSRSPPSSSGRRSR